jgi:hypothetical protein
VCFGSAPPSIKTYIISVCPQNAAVPKAETPLFFVAFLGKSFKFASSLTISM